MLLLTLVSAVSGQEVANGQEAANKQKEELRFAIGDNLAGIVSEYYQQALYRPATQVFSPDDEQVWTGMVFVVASPKPGMLEAPQIIGLELEGRPPVPIGLRQIKEGECTESPCYEYLMDMIGDGQLDTRLERPVVPFYVLYPQGGNPAAWERSLLLLLDYHLESIETSDSPFLPGGSRDELLAEVTAAAERPDSPNRDLRYHLYFCLLHADEPDMVEPLYYAWMYAGSMLYERFDVHHPLPAVYSLWLAHALKRETETIEWIGFLQRIRQGLVPAQIFDTLTTDDPRLRARKRRWVINKNPDHWWVQEYLGD